MATAALIISILSLLISGGSVYWAKRSATAAERSAGAAERSAGADETAATAATAALALEHERAERERRARHEESAPRPELQSIATYDHRQESLVAWFVNEGRSAALLETIVVHSNDGETTGEFPPRFQAGGSAGQPVRAALGDSFGTQCQLSVAAAQHGPVELRLTYRMDGTDLRFTARYELHRTAGDDLGWNFRLGETRIDLLDD